MKNEMKHEEVLKEPKRRERPISMGQAIRNLKEVAPIKGFKITSLVKKKYDR